MEPGQTPTEPSQPPTPSPRRRQRSNPVLLGAILVILGIVFLLQQFTTLKLENWWALFILIPAFSSLGAAYALYRRNGRFTSAAVSSLFSGLIILAVALIFLFGLDWGLYWPLFLILPGLSLLFSGLPLPAGRTESLAWGVYRPWSASIGAALTLLGAGFLLQNLNLFRPADILPTWWAVLILLAAVGGVVAALQAYRKRQTFDWVVLGNLLTAAVIAVVGIVALLGMDWNVLGPIILIAVGVVILLGLLRGARQGA